MIMTLSYLKKKVNFDVKKVKRNRVKISKEYRFYLTRKKDQSFSKRIDIFEKKSAKLLNSL
jgi:hypothetical protein